MTSTTTMHDELLRLLPYLGDSDAAAELTATIPTAQLLGHSQLQTRPYDDIVAAILQTPLPGDAAVAEVTDSSLLARLVTDDRITLSKRQAIARNTATPVAAIVSMLGSETVRLGAHPETARLLHRATTVEELQRLLAALAPSVFARKVTSLTFAGRQDILLVELVERAAAGDTDATIALDTIAVSGSSCEPVFWTDHVARLPYPLYLRLWTNVRPVRDREALTVAAVTDDIDTVEVPVATLALFVNARNAAADAVLGAIADRRIVVTYDRADKAAVNVHGALLWAAIRYGHRPTVDVHDVLALEVAARPTGQDAGAIDFVGDAFDLAAGSDCLRLQACATLSRPDDRQLADDVLAAAYGSDADLMPLVGCRFTPRALLAAHDFGIEDRVLVQLVNGSSFSNDDWRTFLRDVRPSVFTTQSSKGGRIVELGPVPDEVFTTDLVAHLADRCVASPTALGWMPLFKAVVRCPTLPDDAVSHIIRAASASPMVDIVGLASVRTFTLDELAMLFTCAPLHGHDLLDAFTCTDDALDVAVLLLALIDCPETLRRRLVGHACRTADVDADTLTQVVRQQATWDGTAAMLVRAAQVLA